MGKTHTDLERKWKSYVSTFWIKEGKVIKNPAGGWQQAFVSTATQDRKLDVTELNQMADMTRVRTCHATAWDLKDNYYIKPCLRITGFILLSIAANEYIAR